jgi:hypothetical protein
MGVFACIQGIVTRFTLKTHPQTQVWVRQDVLFGSCPAELTFYTRTGRIDHVHRKCYSTSERSRCCILKQCHGSKGGHHYHVQLCPGCSMSDLLLSVILPFLKHIGCICSRAFPNCSSMMDRRLPKEFLTISWIFLTSLKT